MTTSIFCGERKLYYDEACLRIKTEEPMFLLYQVTECFQCDFLPLTNVSGTSDVILSTIYPTKLHFENYFDNLSFSLPPYHFSQHGVYGLNITNNETLKEIFIISPADDVYKPLWILLWATLVSLITFAMVASISRARLLVQLIRTNAAFRELQNDLGHPSETSSRLVGSDFATPSPSPTLGQARRINSLDAFRGIIVVCLVFGNQGSGRYSIFEYSPWNGLTIADFIFPWFIWIMGFATVISVKRQIRAERRRKQVFMSAVRRCLTLFALGVIINSMTTVDLNNIRLTGVLQRIGVTYFIIASLQICFVTPEYISVGNSCADKLSDVLSCWVQWLVVLCMVAVHCCLTFGVKYESCPKGYLGPGGLVEHSEYFNCTGGVASYIDRMVFGDRHMYQLSSPKHIYHNTVPVDPEGLLGVLTSCLTALLGVQAGQILQSFYSTKKRLSRWILWATITGLIGGGLCSFTQEGGVVPINRNLWSVSFVLITASFAFLCLALLHVVVDHWMIWNGAPFAQIGRNSIALYFASCVMANLFPFKWKPLVDDTTHGEYLLMDVFGTLVWISIACILARHKIYITV